MNDAQLNTLERTITKGKWHYVVKHGVIGWGVPTAVFFSILRDLSGDANFSDDIGSSLISFCLAGLGWGLFMWRSLKKNYDRTHPFNPP
jgi:hypothetical protein